MTTYVPANPAFRRPAPLRPDWTGVLVGAAVVLLVWLSMGNGREVGLVASFARAGHVPAAAPARAGDQKLQALLRGAQLTSAETRRVRAALAEAAESHRAAVAFYEALHETDPAGSRPAKELHAAEMDALVEGTVRAKLVEALGADRARVLDRYVSSLAGLAAAAR